MAKLLIGRKIRVVRQLKGYSQEYMAMRLGVSQNAYSKMERGKIKVKNERLQTITGILEIPTHNLYKITEAKFMLNDREELYAGLPERYTKH